MKLVTREKWNKLSPRSKGYVLYMQAELPGSELKGLSNPYRWGSANASKFEEGERLAVLEAQDGDD
jgi:hypothetical protein